SAARSTRSARRQSTPARSVTARVVRTVSAQSAASAPDARSWRLLRTRTTTITSTTSKPQVSDSRSTPVVAVDCNGADLGPAEVAAGAALAAQRGARVMLFGPLAELG